MNKNSEQFQLDYFEDFFISGDQQFKFFNPLNEKDEEQAPSL